jgi:hypothetical protein
MLWLLIDQEITGKKSWKDENREQKAAEKNAIDVQYREPFASHRRSSVLSTLNVCGVSVDATGTSSALFPHFFHQIVSSDTES